MTELKDFQIGGGASLKDFTFEPEKVVINTEAANKNIAAHISLLGGDEPEDTYRNTLGALNSGEDVTGDKGPLSDLISSEVDKTKESLLSVIGDPTVSDEEKVKITKGFNEAFSNMIMPKNLVSSITATAPQVDETLEYEAVTVDVGDVLDKVLKYKSGLQAITNSVRAQSNPTTMKNVGNLLEFLVPLSEGGSIAAVARELKAGNSSFLYNTVLMGDAMKDIVESLTKVPIDQRLEAAQKVADVISSHSGLVFTDDNELAKIHWLEKVLQTKEVFNGWDRTVFNTISLLDASIFGSMFSKVLKGSKLASFISFGTKAAVRSDVSPASVVRNIKDTNPEISSKLDDAVIADTTGEIAEAVAGTTRGEAIADVRLPEIGNAEGKVENKVSVSLKDEVEDFLSADGSIVFGSGEKAAMVEQAIGKPTYRENALGITERVEMFSITTSEKSPHGVKIRGVYGPQKYGYLDPQEALQMAEHGVRGQGVEAKQLTLLKRNDEGVYSPVSKETTDEGNYLVGVDYEYTFNPFDNLNHASPDVKLNFFDRMNIGSSGSQGTIVSHSLSPASRLNPLIMKATFQGEDRALGLEKVFFNRGVEFSEGFVKLTKRQFSKVEQEIKRANKDRTDFDYTKLRGEGFKEDSIQTLQRWEELQRTIHFLRNKSMAKEVRGQGFMIFNDKANEFSVLARPIKQRHVVGNNIEVFDPSVSIHSPDAIRTVSKAELDLLYETGGVVSKMKSPVIIEGNSTTLIISDERVGGNWLRRVNDDDVILPRIPGYYEVAYDAPKFVEKIVSKMKADGTAGEFLYRGAVATAENVQDAALTASRFTKAIETTEINHIQYVVRGDIKSNPVDDAYNLAYSRGATFQRSRGERLHDGSGDGLKSLDDNNILNPIEALTKSIRSISRRTIMGDVLNPIKDRFMKQYDKVLPKGERAQSLYPGSRAEIKASKDADNSLAADARSTWEYINSLENGYINTLGDGYRALFNMTADFAGEISLSSKSKVVGKAASLTEMGTRKLSRSISPDEATRVLASNLLLSLNPLRQLPIQSLQAVRLYYVNPIYMATQSGKDFAMLTAAIFDLKNVQKGLYKFTGHTPESAAKMLDEFNKSGMGSAVDANNLLRGGMKSLVNLSMFDKSVAPILSAVSLSRKLGFDAGESTNIMLAWLAFRDLAKKSGKKWDNELLGNVGAEARNYTYGMNRAGDPPYNRNALGMVMQFAQVAHKAVEAVTTNRILSPKQKHVGKVADVALWGVGIGSVGTFISQFIPDDEPELKKVVTKGLVEYSFNEMATKLYGEEVALDVSSYAPTNLAGFAATYFGLLTTPPGETLANSPSGQLFFGGNARLTTLFRTGLNWFGQGPETKYENLTGLMDVARSAAAITSGGSNAMKAYLALKFHRSLSSMGQVVDPDVNSFEAIGKLFGMSTITEAHRYAIGRGLWEKSKAFEDEAKNILKQQLRMLSNRGMSINEIVLNSKVYEELWQTLGAKTTAGRALYSKLLKKPMSDPNSSLMRSFFKVAALTSPEDMDEIIQMLHASGMDKESKNEMIETFKAMKAGKELSGE